MATEALTDREVPGGGKLNPVNHIVRIVVVRNAADLEEAEGKLKKMPAPPKKKKSAEGGTTSPTPNNMFEALEPTDIVVVGRNPASVREEKAARKLCAHDHHHRETVLRVWTESDTVEYQCDEKFEIAEVKKAGWAIFVAPVDPFSNPKPRTASQETSVDGPAVWVWRSSVVPASANNQQYKMTFKINDELIDPDVVCGDPPPR
jgi:hypothetical protein